jgi:tRNA dimethylallyltransferase
MKSKYLISIVGVTAIGKTTLSIELAKHFKTEIISSDSRQFYREMNIGTAVPTTEELEQVKHHFIQNRSIFEDYSVGEFERDALLALDQLFNVHDVVVMVGGSGLYVDAVLKGLDEFPDVDPEIRVNLKLALTENGIKSLQDRLKILDIEAYQKIDIENKQRLIRALEICLGTGKTFSSFLNIKNNERNFIPIKIGITADRDFIYDRINKRVDVMMQDGLLNEVKELYVNRDLNSLQTVGYKELFEYLDNELTLDKAVSEIKKNTRRFAKRQGTWFRKDKDIEWFEYPVKLNDVTDYVNALLVKNTNNG